MFGISKFSLQKPRIRNYIHEWIFHQLSKDFDLIKLKYEFLNLSINGEDMGSFENPNAKQPSHSNKLLWSLSKLDLDIKTDLNLIKKRYKELAKKHHPDIKGNSKNSIDKFREIVEAYNYLLERYKK